jgi:drug/metabolite transporter (DMT)-like permease
MKTRQPCLPAAALLLGMLIGGLGNTLLGTRPHDPWLLLGWRYLAAVAIMSYWLPKVWALPTRIKVAAVFDFLSVITFVLALSTVSVAAATTIGAFSPLLALVVNHLVGRSKMPALAALPIGLGMIATFLITAQHGQVQIDPLGAFLVALSVIFNTVGLLFNTWHGAGESAMVRAAAANLAGAIVLTPILAITYLSANAPAVDWSLIGMAVLIAGASGTLAKTLILYASKTIPGPLVLAGFSLSLVTAAVSGWLILGQDLTTLGVAGIGAGAAGSIANAYVSGRKPAAASRPERPQH